MTIQSEINKDDWKAYVQFIRNQMKKDGNKNTKAWFVAICFGAAIGFGASIAKIPIDFLSLIIGFFGTALWISFLSRSKLKSIQHSMQPSEDGVFLGPCSISAGDEGMKTVTPNCETLYRWQTVRHSETTEKHIFVVVDNIAAITIPRRSFRSADEQEIFFGRNS